jgi:transcriptional regulator with XRE-family HTH domain
MAGVSNPYLSQIERGMRKPSADILQQIARALRISAEALYVQAGILDDRWSDSDVPGALLADPHVTERQKQVLIEIYESFRRENDAAGLSTDEAPAASPSVWASDDEEAGAAEPAATQPSRSGRPAKKAAGSTRSKADPSAHPAKARRPAKVTRPAPAGAGAEADGG